MFTSLSKDSELCTPKPTSLGVHSYSPLSYRNDTSMEKLKAPYLYFVVELKEERRFDSLSFPLYQNLLQEKALLTFSLAP